MGFCALQAKSQSQIFKAGLQLFLRGYFYASAQQLDIIFGQQMGVYFVHNHRGAAVVFKDGNLAAVIFYGVFNLYIVSGFRLLAGHKGINAYHY